jgi:ribosome-binding protein aMBF1 (putative translation factor)
MASKKKDVGQERFRRDVASRIRTARRLRKMSQQALADSVNLHKNTVQAYENGERLPDVYIAELLAKALDVPLRALVPKMEAEAHERVLRPCAAPQNG